MPANLTPDYQRAEAEYKAARDPRDRLEALQKMLRTIPKHKGTDKLQADLKRRIARTKKECDRGGRKGRRGPSYRVVREGAGQVVLLGPPNAGKSTLVKTLTRAEPEVADYPFTTQVPQPGMMPHQDLAIQLIDLPPVTADYVPAWLSDVARAADAAILVADLAADSVLEDLDGLRDRLREARIELIPEAPATDPGSSPTCELRTLLLGNKLDAPGAAERWEILLELQGAGFTTLAVSATEGTGLDQLGGLLVELLDVIRVYTKQPGRSADLGEPFVLPRGSTIIDVARAVHREVAEGLQAARLWGSGAFDGQHVGRDHPVADGDIVELRT
jgi:ribosome-interacting GTPase 1